MKKILVWSQKPNYGKNTITFNIASKIASKKNGCAILSSKLPEEMIVLKRKYNIKCFDYETNNKKLVSFYLNKKKFQKNNWSLDELKSAISNDINVISKKQNYVFFESSNTDNNFNELILSVSTDVILIYNANEYASNQVLKDLSFVRKAQLSNHNLKISAVILNEYNDQKTEHINSLLNLKKIFNKVIFTIPYNNNLNKESKTAKIYLEKNPWSDFAIKIDEIINVITSAD